MSDILSNLPEDMRNQIQEDMIRDSQAALNTEETSTPSQSSTVQPVTKESDCDVSDIADAILNSESAGVSSVLGNLDDDDEFYSESNKVATTSSVGNDFFASTDENLSFEDEVVENATDSDSAFNEDAVKEEKEYEDKVIKSYADVTGKKANPKLDFVDKIVVDLNNITITDKPVISQVDDMNLVFDTRAASFAVVCCQSGYQATLTGLTLAEKNAINNSNLDMYESRRRLYKTVYDKIQSMNFDKPKFDDWLKITSFGDWNTLVFGIYCQTFIDENEFDITCGKCSKVTSVTINNQSLIEVKDKAVYDKIEEVVAHVKAPEELLAISTVHKNERLMLKDSKIIVDIHTPTLWDHLVLIKQSNPKTIQEYADTFSAMLFIKNLFMLDAKETYKSGTANYYPITSKPALLNVLLKLSNADGEQLEDAIEGKLGKYQIEYRIHNCTCTHCQEKLPDIPVDMESVLFTRINKTRKASK